MTGSRPTVLAMSEEQATPSDWTALAGALLEREVARVGGAASSEADTAVDRAARELEAALDEGAFAAVVTSAELDEASVRTLAVCGAIELDRRLQRLVAHLEADPVATRP